MSMIDLHPHFVAARTYEDVKTVVGLLQNSFDDDDFVPPTDAPFLPPAYTSTIHVSEGLSGQTSTRGNSPSGLSSVRMSGSATSGAATPTSKTSGSGGGGATHAPFGDEGMSEVRTDDTAYPLGAPKPVSAPQEPNVPPASATEFRMRRRASSFREKSGPQKILCVWDVDDTLVATGVSGVRQNLVFKEADLVSLFKDAGPSARHILLSQGSIDDVFDGPGGRLQCIQDFVQRRPHSAQGLNRSASSSTDMSTTRGGRTAATSSNTSKKPSLVDLLKCGGGKQAKDQPSSATSRHRHSKKDREGVGGTDEHDMRHLAPGTVVVRLSSMHDRAETDADSAFLRDPKASPTCGRDPATVMDEKAERMGRWLILRPEVWGITLASMSTIFPSSRNTAFVNGKVYRKMDVVWSLAMSGEWDSVFFIDNNLSEVGVVRYGMQMSDVLNLRSGRKVWRFFQSEFLLLAASAKLREMEQRFGRDVTVPPPEKEKKRQQQEPSQDSKATNGAAKPHDNKKTTFHSSVANTASTASNAASAAGPTRDNSGDGVGEVGGEATPSKSLTSSSSDIAVIIQRGSNSANATAKASPAATAGAGAAAKDTTTAMPAKHEDASGSLQIAVPPLKPRTNGDTRNGHTCNNTSGGLNDDDDSNLSLSSPPLRKEASPSFPLTTTPPMRSLALSPPVKNVDLVVVNLHMTCEKYRRVLTAARTNSDGQRSRHRDGSLPPRFVGQPVFSGDRSCTDEQYDAVLKYFKETESGMFQLLEEEMRCNGYVDTKISNRWIPGQHTVYAPIQQRPTYIPHMGLYYTPFFNDVEEKVVRMLLRYGGTGESWALHSEAQRQYIALQRILTFIDPYLTGDLGRHLFDIYMVDGSIPRSLADHLKKVLNRVRARLALEPQKQAK